MENMKNLLAEFEASPNKETATACRDYMASNIEAVTVPTGKQLDEIIKYYAA